MTYNYDLLIFGQIGYRKNSSIPIVSVADIGVTNDITRCDTANNSIFKI